MSERYLVLLQHEYASPKYWVVAEVESPEDLKDESFQDDLAQARVFTEDEAEIILVKVVENMSADQSRIDKILAEIEIVDWDDLSMLQVSFKIANLCWI